MAKYTVFESTNMRSTYYGERIMDAVADVDIENGTFGYLEGLAEGESNVYKFKAGTKDGEPVVVVDNPAWSENNTMIANQRRDKYIVEAGTRFRVRNVRKTDEFGISAEGITPDTRATVTDTTDFVANNVYLTIDTTGKLKASTSTTEGAVMEARIERKRTVGNTVVTSSNKYGNSTTIYEAIVKTLA